MGQPDSNFLKPSLNCTLVITIQIPLIAFENCSMNIRSNKYSFIAYSKFGFLSVAVSFKMLYLKSHSQASDIFDYRHIELMNNVKVKFSKNKVIIWNVNFKQIQKALNRDSCIMYLIE